MRKSIKKCEKSIKKRVKKILWKNNCGNLPVKNLTVGKYVKILAVGVYLLLELQLRDCSSRHKKIT